MNIAFIVQGEGRGHMTQALALKTLLEARGHTIKRVMIGKSPLREVPTFFAQAFRESEFQTFEGLNFALGTKQREIRLGKSLWQNLVRLPQFCSSLRRFGSLNDCDAVINFYDPLGGMAKGLGIIRAPVIVIAHQFMFFHPAYRKLHFQRFEPRYSGMIEYTRMVGWGAARRMALSFYPEKSAGKIQVVPPILRSALNDLTVSDGDFLLAYILNSGYSDDIAAWANREKVKVKCYWDRPQGHSDGFATFSPLNGVTFLEDMAVCRGVFCTAGFESVSEAAFLQKPLVVCPVEGHMEQEINARDAEFANIAFPVTSYDLAPLVDGRAKPPSSTFRDWVLQGPEMFVRTIEGVVDPQPRCIPVTA